MALLINLDVSQQGQKLCINHSESVLICIMHTEICQSACHVSKRLDPDHNLRLHNNTCSSLVFEVYRYMHLTREQVIPVGSAEEWVTLNAVV